MIDQKTTERSSPRTPPVVLPEAWEAARQQMLAGLGLHSGIRAISDLRNRLACTWNEEPVASGRAGTPPFLFPFAILSLTGGVSI